jgi:hypothetical protein
LASRVSLGISASNLSASASAAAPRIGFVFEVILTNVTPESQSMLRRSK